MVRGYKQFGELFVPELRNPKARIVWGTVCTRAQKPESEDSLGNCLYPSLETRKRGSLGIAPFSWSF